MSEIARHWRVLAGGIGACAAGVAGVLGVTSTASAQPTIPQPTVPIPATVTQTVTVAPNAAATVPAAAGPAAVPAAAGPAAVPAAATPAVPVVPPRPVSTITPATSGTLAEFFASKGVAMEPQSSRDFRALNIVLPKPRGWEHIPDPNVPDAFAVLADRVGGNGLYSSNAQVTVYKLVGQFDGLVPSVLEGTKTKGVNGEFTLGENIGDLGGLGIAHRALEIWRDEGDGASLDAAAGDREFFTAWATVWRQLTRPEAMVTRIASDPHSPNEFRCNQVVKNIDAFHEAFGTREGDPMWLAPEERVTIW